jgi:hypothetical protein
MKQKKGFLYSPALSVESLAGRAALGYSIFFGHEKKRTRNCCGAEAGRKLSRLPNKEQELW